MLGLLDADYQSLRWLTLRMPKTKRHEESAAHDSLSGKNKGLEALNRELRHVASEAKELWRVAKNTLSSGRLDDELRLLCNLLTRAIDSKSVREKFDMIVNAHGISCKLLKQHQPRPAKFWSNADLRIALSKELSKLLENLTRIRKVCISKPERDMVDAGFLSPSKIDPLSTAGREQLQPLADQIGDSGNSISQGACAPTPNPEPQLDTDLTQEELNRKARELISKFPSVTQVADLSNYSRGHISRISRGEKPATRDFIELMEKLANSPPDRSLQRVLNAFGEVKGDEHKKMIADIVAELSESEELTDHLLRYIKLLNKTPKTTGT